MQIKQIEREKLEIGDKHNRNASYCFTIYEKYLSISNLTFAYLNK